MSWTLLSMINSKSKSKIWKGLYYENVKSNSKYNIKEVAKCENKGIWFSVIWSWFGSEDPEPDDVHASS